MVLKLVLLRHVVIAILDQVTHDEVLVVNFQDTVAIGVVLLGELRDYIDPRVEERNRSVVI